MTKCKIGDKVYWNYRGMQNSATVIEVWNKKAEYYDDRSGPYLTVRDGSVVQIISTKEVTLHPNAISESLKKRLNSTKCPGCSLPKKKGLEYCAGTGCGYSGFD